ncbi:transposase [Sinorhizobium sp. GL28]|uniref:transposase n=1 Tax=Sinorhizobium sp. GL28 TaxID=1358418 RepID=UPI001AECD355|nr:transposase [Sinorhizobium sp. GL28]
MFPEACLRTCAAAFGCRASFSPISSNIAGDDASLLEGWIAEAGDSELASLAAGISRDIEAVRGAIKHRWTTSPVEGQINRLKTLKRQMYGRAGYALLRSRVLMAA